MPKSILVDPHQALARDQIRFTEIEVNAYQATIQEELARNTPERTSRTHRTRLRR